MKVAPEYDAGNLRMNTNRINEDRDIEPRTSNFAQIVKYLVVGGLSALIELGLFYFLSNLLNSIVVPNIMSVGVSTLFNFACNRFATFKSSQNIFRSALLYLALLVFNTCLTTFLISLLSSSGIMSSISAKFLMMCCVTIWNYALYRTVIFK